MSSTTVQRIAHTAASPEGENSTYVLPDRGLVVDPGPPGEAPWETLTNGLAAAGLPVDAIGTVAVTHWHADHAGVAPRLAAAADAELVLHENDAPLVADYAAERERRLDRDARRLRAWGVPDATVADIVDGDTPSPMPDACPVSAVTDGESVAGAEAVHTPGHTAGHLALLADDALLVGDAVLPTYTPNVGGSDTRLDAALSTYLDTLDELVERFGGDTGSEAAAPPDAYPGHGPTVDLPDRIRTIRDHHADRTLDAVAALPDPGDNTDDGEPGPTPWAVANDLFGEMAGIHAKMGAGEAAAHLAFAADHGFAERVGEAPDRYVRARRTLDIDSGGDGLRFGPL
ncbi:MBL fold hydrolase [Halobellus salinus]|uniref:MBL fold hydrolase n=1 Tax=Halobellus salinus TaxID=931585 RepID=A0A830EKR2_9EURY|nr:MBL fold metallo-hydrolase [Halobellus salinus]GGJ00451.1 MBL fold hydrolase [Halobellus salinus]SMP01464.1 Glyoxylase, beta-lactamase superfamily II [Halobellus salinus]